jgi:hypothetical protein
VLRPQSKALQHCHDMLRHAKLLFRLYSGGQPDRRGCPESRGFSVAIRGEL